MVVQSRRLKTLKCTGLQQYLQLLVTDQSSAELRIEVATTCFMVPVLVVCSLKYFIEIAACENPGVRENGHLSVKAINSSGKVKEKMQARAEGKRTQLFC